MIRQEERLGLLFAGLCALNGAFVPAIAKLTTEHGTPLFVAAGTTLFAGLFAALMLVLRDELRLLTRRDVGLRLFVVGALGTAAAFLLFYRGASRATAIEAVLCLQTEPAYSLLLSWVALGHRPTPRRLMAIGILLLGITLAVGARGFQASAGIWLLLLTPLCWQLSHLVVLRQLPGVRPSVLTGARYVYGGAFLALMWFIGGAARPAWPELRSLLPLLALQGVVLSYIGTLLWYQAIARLDLARSTAIVVPSVPLLSLGASFLLLGEVPSAGQWIGLTLTAVGVFTFVTAPHAVARRDTAAVSAAADAPPVDGVRAAQ